MRVKRILLILILIVSFCGPVSPAHAGWYHTVGFAPEVGGNADATSFSVEVGRKDLTFFGQPVLLAGGIAGIYHGDGNVPEETIGSKAPHSDIKRLGDRDDGTEPGLYVKAGRETFKKGVFLTLALGISQVQRVSLVQSNPTELYYAQSSDKEIEFLYGFGISWFPDAFFDWDLTMNFQMEYDLRRGLILGAGWCW